MISITKHYEQREDRIMDVDENDLEHYIARGWKVAAPAKVEEPVAEEVTSDDVLVVKKKRTRKKKAK